MFSCVSCKLFNLLCIIVDFCKFVAISCNNTAGEQQHGCCSVHFYPNENNHCVKVNINTTSDFIISIVEPSGSEIVLCGEPSYTEVRVHSEYCSFMKLN